MNTYERYCQIRDLKNLKDANVATIAEIGKSTFSDWKSDRSKPKESKMKKIAYALDVPVEFLTGEINSFQCKECGCYYNPLNKDSSNEHKYIHNNFCIAKEEYPFLENTFSATANIKKYMEKIGDSNLSNDEIIASIKRYIELLFSTELAKYDYQLNILDYEEFCKNKVSTYLNATWISQEIKEILIEIYSIDKNFLSGNEQLLARISNNSQIMRILTYIEQLNPDMLNSLEVQIKALAENTKMLPL